LPGTTLSSDVTTASTPTEHVLPRMRATLGLGGCSHAQRIGLRHRVHPSEPPADTQRPKTVDYHVQHFDLVIIGTGSGNSSLDQRFAGMKVAIVEKGTFGGTCLNVGCIPTKMFVHTADVASTAANGHRDRKSTRLN